MKLYAAATVALFLLAAIQTTPTAAEEQETESADEAISEPPIKLVHVLNPGEREYLSPNLIGVQNIAMSFLPLSMNFVNIIDAFREIVNGVRYEILLNAVDTKANDADTICRLVILEKPWLTTQWGDKHRELVNTNCSDVADNALTDPDERAKALNEKYVSNTIFNGGRRNELSDSDMAHLEAQILTNENKRRVSSSSSSSSGRGSSISTSTTSSTTALPPQAVPTNEPATSINVNEAAAADVESDTGDANTSAAASIAMTTPTAELNENEKRWLDDFLSVGAFNFEKTIEEQRSELKQQQQQQQQREETAPVEEQQQEPVEEQQQQEQTEQEQQQQEQERQQEQQQQQEQDAQQSSLS
ncbi:hypothetical protein AWZ03_004784 [Drosophila navojoa]|uniref:Cystatin domain-containing protein n=1 Tax=Drosophila navojoa TaxID=7232 RepID=A0A484BMB3_DRONA|nr:hypothetical protein AWZ03_004784 [Drosophila navojoa]